MKKILHFLLFLLLFVSFLIHEIPTCIYASDDTKKAEDTSKKDTIWPKAPSLSASTAVLMDRTTGTILYSKKADKPMYPASLTKILTALIAIENSSLSEEVLFSSDAIHNTEGSSVGIKPGEILTMKDCLYALMLESANEVAYAIAEHVGGSIESFVDMMNSYATELGCKNTHFANPHGLHDENHYTSAYDLALISRAAMNNSIFRAIVYTQTYQIGKTNLTNEIRYCNNHHQMRYAYRYPQFKYDPCIGGKTGYTNAAGYTLATFARQNDMDLICIVMDAGSPFNKKNEYTDSINLFNYGFENFKYVTVSSWKNTIGIEHPVSFGRYNLLFNKNESPLFIDLDGVILLPKDISVDQVEYALHPFDTPKTELEEETIIGQIVYSYADHVVSTSNVIYKASSNAVIIPEAVSSDPAKLEESADNTKPSSMKLIIICSIAAILLLSAIGFLLYFLIGIRPRRQVIVRSSYWEHASYRSGNRKRSRRRKKNNRRYY